MYNPVATYRLQLHKEFNFSQLLSVLDYLKELGVITLYASPIFKSVSGSTHGYDGLDPNTINPEIGDLSQLKEISTKLRENGMGWLQDIVPNHMAFDSNNSWLMDVLEKGPRSVYTKYFDIQEGADKIMVPFLGSHLDEAIEKKEVQLVREANRWVVKYFDSHYPLNASGYANIIRLCCQDETFEALAARIDALDDSDFAEQWDAIRYELFQLVDKGDSNVDVESLNENKEIIKGILDQQYYRLCHWQETDTNINYRRFFTVNGLICMNANDPEVFQTYHSLVRSMLSEKIFQGLRVDHADGLYDPKSYLQNLRDLALEDTYIVIEKILGKEEWLPDDWPVQGNTGYDYLSVINNLLTNSGAEKALTRYYSSIGESKNTISQQVKQKKSHILYHHMQGELNNLYRLFRDLQLVSDEEYDKHSADVVKAVIGALLVSMPVYRFYGSSIPLESEEEDAVRNLFRIVKQSEPEHLDAASWLETLLLDQPKNSSKDFRFRMAHFYKRLMQFSGPLMAKGVEDTLMYTHNRLLSRNEVGDSPESFGISAGAFHHLMIKRREQCPLSLNATATHDTKRGEDARARIHVISDVPALWLQLVKEWRDMNADLKKDGLPDANDEYMIYQSLVGSYPFGQEEEKDFPERLKGFLQKALREGKRNSNWSEPNEKYEAAVIKFAEGLLDKERPFFKSFQRLLHKISEHGMVNSLVQLVSKFTAPGIPDIYQGCELWDLSFVDPDNRRSVDYGKRKRLLREVSHTDPVALWNTRVDGRIKLWLTHKLLQLRKEYETLFTAGEYIPIGTAGKYREHVIAWGRKLDGVMVITILPLHTASIADGPLSEHDWEDTKVILPDDLTGDSFHFFHGGAHSTVGELFVSELFRQLPFAIIRVQVKEKERKSGVLLHITSLPSAYGIGDLGPEAFSFADFLSRSSQKLWQVLPLNPTSEGQTHSPYSATSSIAGNPLLISPDMLMKRGWLDKEDLAEGPAVESDRVLFDIVEKWKNKVFVKAWERFNKQDQSDFSNYCRQEEWWLHDFALFTLLKEKHAGRAWSDWPQELKMRDPGALDRIAKEHQLQLDFIKWLQYVFHLQWSELRSHANSKGIRMVGDLPFYVSYDSADVWVNRHLFALDEEGKMISVAGVPPDAFSEDGQLWGMPVFNWEKLKETNYQWWVNRIRKNNELFDAIRLDHFRAFSAYWDVPGNEDTAKNGKWVDGPTSDLFEVLQTELGDLPFIAEDLGDIDPPVRQLRDQFQLPGMKVLQFAFGDDFGRSEFMPHRHAPNFVVYTGTHDNNTVKGWWENEADERTRERVRDYAGFEINAGNVSGYFCRLAYSSSASQVIVPVQDLLGLDGSSRMNRPSSVEDNWSWRLLPGQITTELEIRLRKWTRVYDR